MTIRPTIGGVCVAGLLACFGALAGCRSTPPAEAPPQWTDGERVARWLTGSFSSRAQAEADAEHYHDIRLEVVPIWRDRGDGSWLYVEQAAAARLDRPYRQRVYHVVDEGDGAVRSDVYTLPGEAFAWAGAWRDPGRFDGVTPADLTLRTGCSIYLTRTSTFLYEGSTRGKGCASTLRGAAFATSRVRLAPKRLESWDRGYDAVGRQVWGATEGPYVFDRVATPR